MPKLRVIAGAKSGNEFTIMDEEEVTIGRDHTCHLQIADPKASRVHAKVLSDEHGYHLEDCKSSNGTWSEDGRIDSVPLEHGFVFSIPAGATPSPDWPMAKR